MTSATQPPALPPPSPSENGAQAGASGGHGGSNLPQTVAALWAESWARLRAAFPDLDALLARTHAGARAEAAAGRMSSRVLRGEADPAELVERLQAWEKAVTRTLGEASGQGETP